MSGKPRLYIVLSETLVSKTTSTGPAITRKRLPIDMRRQTRNFKHSFLKESLSKGALVYNTTC
jgi:hypothetical protein